MAPSQNTDAKLLIYRLFQEGRVLAQDGIFSEEFLKLALVRMQAIRVAVPCKAFAVKVIDLSVTQAATKPVRSKYSCGFPMVET